MHKKYHLQDQPLAVGERIFEDRIGIPGLHHRRGSALGFCRGRNQHLVLCPDPGNQHDAAAIAIYGHWRAWIFDKKEQLGFLPREIAGNLKETGLANSVRARLLKTYAGADGYVEIELQILGPASEYLLYRPLGERPVDRALLAEETGDDEARVNALTSWIKQAEREAEVNGWGVAPRPYLDLAKLYRRLNRIGDEIAVLERYGRQKEAPGALPGQLSERLQKARQLQDKQDRR